MQTINYIYILKNTKAKINASVEIKYNNFCIHTKNNEHILA
jgi:hypothetical protein